MNAKTKLFACLLIATITTFSVLAQMGKLQRNILIQRFENDSIHASYNVDYFLIEDSCADIIRLGYYDMAKGTFKGPFKDVRKATPGQLIATGSYDENGLKQGLFTSYYINGNPQALGHFKDDRFDGKWEFFYSTGKSKITFIAKGNDITILHTWNEDGKKIVDNGHGWYESVIGAIQWKGLLIGGKPDGKWTAQRMFIPREEILATERFKLGVLQKGTNQAGDYNDSSRILLLTPDMLPLTRAEKWFTAMEPCGVTHKKQSMSAWYVKGPEVFTEEIKKRLEFVFNKINISPYQEPLEIRGKIMEDGRIFFSTTKGGDTKLTAALLSQLQSLPTLEPARLDGKAVQQDILLTIQFNASVYSFTYRFVPIKSD